MELVIRRRVKGLYISLRPFKGWAMSVLNVYRGGAYQLFIIRYSRFLIHTGEISSLGTERPVVFSLAFVFENLSRGPPELVWKLFILCLAG
jgi:hypothetical protein